jgi:hypothetical protein
MPPTHAPALNPRSVPWPALVIAVASVCSSCSILGMQRLEPDLPAGVQPECTSTWTMPLVDMGLAALTGSTAVLLHAAASGRENDGKSGGGFRAAGWTATGVFVGFVASGSYGAYQRGRCRRAEVAYEGKEGEPAFLREGRPLKGAAGSSCQKDEDCDEDLLCGQAMKTCVPANPPGSPPP